MLRIAIVGTGWWGMELGRAAKAAPDQLEIAGCTSLSEEECARFVAAYGGKRYGRLEDVLADRPVGAVLLATPHSLHWKQIVQVAEAGKHVFCEKPFTLSVETASIALRACEKAGVVLGVGHNRRYQPGVKKIKALVDGGALGKVIHVEANYSGNVEGRYPPGHWRIDPEEAPAGATTPMGMHMIDTLTWLLGPVARLSAITKRQALSYPLDDTCAALFELQSGATGSFGSHLACAPAATLRLFGTRANIEARLNFSEVLLEPTDPGAPRELHRFTVDESLTAELRALADACAGKAPFPVRPIEALRNVAVLEAMRQSAARGNAWVSVAQEPTV